MSVAVKLLCVTIRYCGCAGQAVIGVVCGGAATGVSTAELTESDCSVVLSEYCELVQIRLAIYFIQLSGTLLTEYSRSCSNVVKRTSGLLGQSSTFVNMLRCSLDQYRHGRFIEPCGTAQVTCTTCKCPESATICCQARSFQQHRLELE